MTGEDKKPPPPPQPRPPLHPAPSGSSIERTEDGVVGASSTCQLVWSKRPPQYQLAWVKVIVVIFIGTNPL